MSGNTSHYYCLAGTCTVYAEETWGPCCFLNAWECFAACNFREKGPGGAQHKAFDRTNACCHGNIYSNRIEIWDHDSFWCLIASFGGTGSVRCCVWETTKSYKWGSSGFSVSSLPGTLWYFAEFDLSWNTFCFDFECAFCLAMVLVLQGIVYALLDRKEDADMQFDVYRSLVPDEFPDKSFISDVILAARTESHDRLQKEFDSEFQAKKWYIKFCIGEAQILLVG